MFTVPDTQDSASAPSRPLWQRLLATDNADGVIRLLMSFLSAAVLAAVVMAILSVLEAALPNPVITYTMADGHTGSYTRSPIDDEHVTAALALAGMLWCAALAWIWRGFRRGWTWLVVLFQVFGAWLVAVPFCVFLDKMLVHEELPIATVILLAIATNFYFVAKGYARWKAPRPVIAPSGEVRVFCPRCRYSMVGLRESRCPECGTQYTLDDLIRQQDYSLPRGAAQ